MVQMIHGTNEKTMTMDLMQPNAYLELRQYYEQLPSENSNFQGSVIPVIVHKLNNCSVGWMLAAECKSSPVVHLTAERNVGPALHFAVGRNVGPVVHLAAERNAGRGVHLQTECNAGRGVH